MRSRQSYALNIRTWLDTHAAYAQWSSKFQGGLPSVDPECWVLRTFSLNFIEGAQPCLNYMKSKCR